MAATPGKAGAIYYRKARIQGTTLAFVDSNPDTITDSGNGFVTAGFAADDLIVVTGSTNNDGTYTIDTGGVAAGTLTLIAGDTLVVEGASANIIIQEALPGTQVLGFSNWALDQIVDVLEVTRFEDVGVEKNITGVRRWTATADKFFETTQLTTASWLGDELLVRYFFLYDDAPNITTVYYQEGKCFVSGISPGTDTQGVANETITFAGTAKASIAGITIAFVDSNPDTITDSGNGFVTAGFDPGDKITITGATNAGNNSTFTVDDVDAGTLTLASGDALTVESAGAAVAIRAEVRLTTRTTAWPT